MKKLLLILLLTVASFSFGQSYRLKIYDYKFEAYTADGRCATNELWIDVTVNRVVQRVYTEYPNTFSSNILLEKNFNGPITKILFHTMIHEKGGLIPNCNGDTSFIDVPKTIYDGCGKGSIIGSHSDGDASTKINFKYSVTPNISLTQAGVNDVPIEAEVPINIQAPSGYSSSVYNWKYSLGSPNNFISIPGTSGQLTMRKKPEDFLTGNYIGQRIYFLIETCSGFRSNTIYYDIFPSPPKVTIHPRDNAMCPYSEETNGGFVAEFDRGLYPGENINMTLYQEIPDQPYKTFVSNQIESLDDENKFTWPSIVDVGGSYYVKYESNTGSFVSVVKNSKYFEIKDPPSVTFDGEEKNPVSCFGGSNGEALLTASGGAGDFEYEQNGSGDWIPFENPESHTVSNLTEGTYSFKVRDASGCSEQVDDEDKTIEVNITEPLAGITYSFVSSSNAKLYGSSDGNVTVDVRGGTPFPDGSYEYTWSGVGISNPSENSSGRVHSNGAYRISLSNQPKGSYQLSITDANYSAATATQTLNCNPKKNFSIGGIDALVIKIEKSQSISCNPKNTFGDPSDDGELKANVRGGVTPYTYIWKKKNSSGNWEVISGASENLLSNLSEGEYAFNVIDKNGFAAGTYSGSRLIRAVDATYNLRAPYLPVIQLTKQDVYCFQGSDGEITATVSGGTPPFSYRWNTGDTSSEISSLTIGTYTVNVTDKYNCRAVTASITITQPKTALIVEVSSVSPTYAGATNGSFTVTVTGGTLNDEGTYTYLWEDQSGKNLSAQVSSQLITRTITSTTGVQTNTTLSFNLRHIGAGDYFLTVQDNNYAAAITNSNCGFTLKKYTLNEPEPLALELVIDQPISCSSSNTYDDPYDNGILVANATGGVSLKPTENNGLSYFYTWRKKDLNGVWQLLSEQTSSVLSDLIAGNYAVNIEDANGIILGTYSNNKLVRAEDVTVDLTEPPLLEITSITNQNAYCYEGSDGWAQASITGGTPPYSIVWTSGATATLAQNLGRGTHNIQVTDSQGCQVTSSTFVDGPTDPLKIEYTDFRRPSSSGASDGWIEAKVTGGTPFENASYGYSWTNKAGVSLNSKTVSSTLDNGFQVRLNDLSLGEYLLTVTDVNFSKTATNSNCQIVEDSFEIYEPIEATISIKNPISCHPSNTFDNTFSDGLLVATVSGGLPFDSGTDYRYHWKKQNSSYGYEELPGLNGPIAEGLSPGNYALNVEDSLGNIIGIYEGFTLVRPTDILVELNAPQPLVIEVTSTPISCETDTNGTAKAQIFGGTPPYLLEWSNGATTANIDDLFAGTYILYLIDSRGCEASAQVEIESPGGLEASLVLKTNPTCFEGEDGSIEVAISGGVPPYQYEWNNGSTSIKNKNLTQGEYHFKVTDANNCKAYFSDILEDPDPVLIDIGEDRTLCSGQAHIIDITSEDIYSTYRWESDNGFRSSSSVVSLTEAGTYTAYYTTGLGCVGSDSIVIKSENLEIDAEFLITTQAFVNEEVILINTSSPISTENKWIVPESVQIVSESNEALILKFNTPGVFDITLSANIGDCYQNYTKGVLVGEPDLLGDIGDAEVPFILNFEVSPIPNNGAFKVTVELASEATISLGIFSLASRSLINRRQLNGKSNYSESYQMDLSSGVYYVLLETAVSRDLRKVIVLK